jgi:hypothetical protein
MSPTRVLIAALVASSTSLLACTAAPDGLDGEETEDTAQASSALKDNGGGAGTALTSQECTDCGCRLVLYEKTGQCNKYYCVCDSDEGTTCAGGKARTVTEPVSPIKDFKFGTFGGVVGGGMVYSP